METAKKPMPLGVDSYLEWVKKEGIRVHQGLALNLFEVETEDWPRFGISGAATHFTGARRLLLDVRVRDPGGRLE